MVASGNLGSIHLAISCLTVLSPISEEAQRDSSDRKVERNMRVRKEKGKQLQILLASEGGHWVVKWLCIILGSQGT